MNAIANFFYQLVLKERSPEKLALSSAIGVYIAFSPFLFLHTAMSVGLSIILGLNMAVVLAVSMVVNNLWTMLPIYITDYLFGHWLLHSMFDYGTYLYVPWWLETAQTYIASQLGLPSICFWSFMVGGNLLGLGLGLIIYPGILLSAQAVQKRNLL